MIQLPTICPSCGYKLEFNKTKIDLYCYNDNCEAKSIRKILHFFQTINNLDGFGPKTIEKLIEYGCDSIEKIYSLNYIDFQDMGYKYKTIMNLGSELEFSKERPIEPYIFIAALGIKHLGIGSAKEFCNNYKWVELIEIKEHHLICLDGFGNIKSSEIFQEIQERKLELIKIFDIGFNIRKEKINVTESTITGKTICFTGKSSRNRKEMQKEAESLGAKSVGIVNSKTNILVCGEKVGKNKTEAAERFGTLVLTEEEYFKMIENL